MEILSLYKTMKNESKNGHYSKAMSLIFDELYQACIESLSHYDRVNLISKVPSKKYFAFSNGSKTSRAINCELYNPSYDDWKSFLSAMQSNCIDDISKKYVSQVLYTMAISFCSCIDMIKNNDQKTPGTFFEYFIAFFYTWRVKVEPQKSIQILNIDDDDTKLSTDFIYNLGPKQKKFHMPIKTSTRERSIMLWAHQRLLDGVYGTGRFMGTPVLLTETKTDKTKKEVVEICLPDQWKLYQLYIAKLKRIYYLDVPTTYIKLNDEFPPIRIKPFADFFYEWQELNPE